MKKIFRIVLWIVGILAVLIGGMATYISIRGIPTYPELAAKIPKDYKVAITPERTARGQKLAAIVCNDCHISNDEPRLSGKKLLDIPTEFGIAYSKNLTNDPEIGIGKWTDGEIAYFLRTGVRADGSFAPAYMPKFPLLSEEDMESVISFLRSNEVVVQASKREPPLSEPSFLMKVLTHFVMKPYPFDAGYKTTPPVTDKMVHGKYLADAVLGCTNCHSLDFKTNNELDPTKNQGYCGGGNPLLDMEGNTIFSANLSPDKETGLGNWSENEFIACVLYGKGRNGQPMRYPMTPKTTLDSAEVKAIFAYLQSVPAIKNPVNRSLVKASN